MKRIATLQAIHGAEIIRVLKADPTAASRLGFPMDTTEPSEIFTKFCAAADPTAIRTGSPYKYLSWICRQYVAEARAGRPVAAEDLYKIHNDLRDFESWSGILAADDRPNQIDQIADLSALRAVLRPYQERRDARRAEQRQRHMSDEKRARIARETTTVYDGPEGRIVMPHSRESSQHWGAQTRWCIAAHAAHNYFASYNAKTPVLVYLPRPTPDERSAWPYTSFKFAGVGENIYDEHDNSRCETLPPCLKTLLLAAENTLPAAALSFLRRYGAVDAIRRTGCVPPPPAPEPESHRDPFHEDPRHRTWNAVLDSLGDPPSFTGREDLLLDREFALYSARRHSGQFFAAMPEKLRADREIAAAAVIANTSAFEHVAETLRHDRRFALDLIPQIYYLIRKLPPALQADREIARAAIEKNGSSLSDVFPPIRWHESRLTRLFRQCALPLLHGLPNLHRDRELVTAAIKGSGSIAFRYASRKFRGDREMLALAGPYSYEYATRTLRHDRTIAYDAAMRHAENFKYAPRHLRADRDLLLALIEKQPQVLEYAPNAIKQDRDFILQAVRINGLALAYTRLHHFASCSYPYINDRDVCLAAVSNNGLALGSVYEDLRYDRDINMAAVANNGFAYQHVAGRLKNDRELALTAVRQNGLALEHVTGYDLQNDADIVYAATEQTPDAFPIVRRRDYPFAGDPGDDDDFMRRMVARDPGYLPYAREALRRDPAFVAQVVRQYRDEGRFDSLIPHLRHVPSLWGADLDTITEPASALAALDVAALTAMPLRPPFRHPRERGGIHMVF